ncbi:protein-disulfide reductase DsbD [Legionella septentrionalis]|uniref:protein-disulfide reductase DsbD n=1 Tax=Legionella septentrionalis TaxID=2498109 RepID=UPI000F8F26BF|nr:protein-disulfide reductase DsbD [Legionella septentrionalis]RUQ98523.1 protein-disulfide reductase DsbD [Legionella septentrionalis]RUR10910.1 protein-disulfide reductase DsbD [Legionella septentrionalis]
MKKYLASILLLIPLLGYTAPPKAADIFTLAAKVADPNTLLLSWEIKPGYFLYKDRIKLLDETNSTYSLGRVIFPRALKKTDKLGRTYAIYREKVLLSVPILGRQPGESILHVHFQGCADNGFCYPPQSKKIKLTLNTDLALQQAEAMVDSAPLTQKKPENKAEQILSTNNMPFIMLGFLGFGLLLAFTPCVLPMLPVLSGIIVGHGPGLSTRKAFLLSLSYVLSMAFTYAVVGAIVALMGQNLQIFMQSPVIITLFSLFFVALALSMFNFYDLRLPLSWQNKLASVTRSQEGGHYLTAALMGCLSTLILSPCVTAPLIGALSYIAHTGNIVFGTLALFFLGLGMGLPLLLIGLSAGKLLPKAGHWMNTVKSFFGILLIALAIYLMERVLPAIYAMLLWSGLLVFSGIYMGALTPARSNSARFAQGLGIMFLGYGLLILIGASQGNTNPLLPLMKNSEHKVQLSYPVAKNIAEAQQALAAAKGKPVILDFYADWCSACKVIAATTLQDPHVLKVLNKFALVKIDVTANDHDAQALLKHFNVVAPPTFLFFDARGDEIINARIVGEITAKSFFIELKKILSSES